MWVWVVGVILVKGAQKHTESINEAIDFLVRAQGQTGQKIFFSEVDVLTISSAYYSYSDSGIVGPNYSALLDIGLFAKFSLFIHPYLMVLMKCSVTSPKFIMVSL